MNRVALEKLIQIAGSKAALATALNITRGAVSQWDCVPESQLLKCESLFGIPARMIRPDLSEWRINFLRERARKDRDVFARRSNP